MREKKSLEMKNFIFKSKDITSSDFTKIFIKLETIQKEQRHARVDLKTLINQLDRILEVQGEAHPGRSEDMEQVPEEEGI